MLGPLLAFLVIGVLAAVLRAVFGPEQTPPRVVLGQVEDYGLLCAAAIADNPQTALQIRSRLGAAGIRSTLATGTDQRLRVLVFEGELERARRVVG